MKIGFLSSGKLSIPLIQTLAHNQLLAWVAVPNEQNEGVSELVQYLNLLNINYFLIEKHNFNTFLLENIEKYKISCIFVLGFPWKLKKNLLSYPSDGCWNFHFGHLPEYRGNAPIFWQIKQQEKFAAVTVHKMTEGFDEGAIAHVEKTSILPYDTYGTLEKKLSFLAVNAAGTFINQLLQNTLKLNEQNHSLAKIYKKPAQNDVCIDWQNQTAIEIKALVNATNPWNKGAYTMFQQQYVRLLQVSILDNKRNIQAKAGTIVKADAEGLWVMCKGNILLEIEVLYADEGYFTGKQFVKLGITKNMYFM